MFPVLPGSQNGSDNQLASLFGDVEQRQSGQYLAVDCSLVRPILCALLSLISIGLLLRCYALALSFDCCFLVAHSLFRGFQGLISGSL